MIKTITNMDEIKMISGTWKALQHHPNSDISTYISVLESDPLVLEPYILSFSPNDTSTCLAVGRIENYAQECKIGYLTIMKVKLKILNFIYQGFLGTFTETEHDQLMDHLEQLLKQRKVDAVRLTHLDTRDDLIQIAEQQYSILRRNTIKKLNRHWRMTLPDTVEQLHTMSRRNFRYRKRLRKDFGGKLETAYLHNDECFDRIIEDLEYIASRTYHRKMGVGFKNNKMTRQRLYKMLMQKRLRTYIMYINSEPAAFWQGTKYGEIFYTGTTGYLDKYRKNKIGISLLLDMLEDLTENTDTKLVDFGLGNAEYKMRLCDDNWEETTLFIYSTSFKALGTNILCTSFQGIDRAGNRILNRVGMDQRLKSLLKRRMT